MKCIVIYFSQTGNTEKIAKAIQAGVKQAAGNCDIVKIRDANPRRLYGYDLIGLGSPVLGVEPGNVKAFINDMRFVGGKHTFSFCTHGTHPELYFPSVVPKLKRRGLVVIGTRDWYGTVYIASMPKPYLTDGHPDEIDLKEAEDFGREMVARSQRISAGETKLIPPVPKWPEWPKKEDLVPSALKRRFASMLKFHPEICNYPECRLCMDNCPMDGIDLSMKPPVVAKPCIDCTFCARLCPTGAMDSNAFWRIMEVRSAKSIKGFLVASLGKAQAEGHFRPLVPLDKVGSGTPIYKAHKHPQWVIGKGLQ